MPDLFAELEAEKAREQQELSQTNPTGFDPMQEQQPDPMEQPLDISGNYSADPQQQTINENNAYSSQKLGGFDTTRRDDPNMPESWSPDYTARGFVEESANGILRGVGKYGLKGVGDLLQVAGSWAGFDIGKGTVLSRALQDAGTEMSDKFKGFIPEELQHENLTMGSMMNPKFWSIHVSEMIPQLAEFIFLSKGGASLAKKGAKEVLTKLPGVGKTALKGEVFRSGKGLAGKLATDTALTSLGSGIAGAVGGGITSNAFAGILNAADVVNSNKDETLKDRDGNEILDENGETQKMYTEEQLSQMASGTMRNNATYLAVDIASWGMTYGGGWKALRGLNPVAKGGKLFTPAQRLKTASNLFSYDTAPIIKGLGKMLGKGVMEGVEETFQETYEEWAKKRAVAEVNGEYTPDTISAENAKDFWKFYNSKENEATRVLSFAVGGLGGAAFNVGSLISKKADESYKLYNATENLANIVDKQGTEEELSWQQFHIRQTIANIVIDDKIGLYKDFSQQLVDNKNITEEERAEYDTMLESFQDMKSKGKNLNVKGLSALMHNVATESFIDGKIAEYEAIAKDNVEIVNSLGITNEGVKKQKIQEIETLFKKRMKALTILKAESKQNQENLIIGKKAGAIKLDIKLDKFGNEMVIGGLSTQQEADYALKKGETLQDNIGDIGKKEGMKMPDFSGLADKGKGLAKDLFDQFVKTKDVVVDKVKSEVEKRKEAKKDDAVQEGTTLEESVQPKNKEEAQQAASDLNDEVEVEEAQLKDENGDPIADPTDLTDVEITPELIQTIADKVRTGEKLTEVENNVRLQNENDVIDAITQGILGTKGMYKPDEKVVEEEVVEEEEIKDKDLSEKEKAYVKAELAQEDLTNDEIASLQKQYGVTIERDGKGAFTVTKGTKFSRLKAKGKIFKVLRGKRKETIKAAEEVKIEKAKQQFKIDKKKIKGSESNEDINFDKRAKTEKAKSIRDLNIKDAQYKSMFKFKLRNKHIITEGMDISQNEVDNYLNRFTTYNLLGPSNLDKMVVVNHQLKRMFPVIVKPDGTKDVVSAFMVKNLFESVGSLGLGTSIAMTMFIDEKSWEQSTTYMHELSHIYYKLGRDMPETLSILKKAMADPKRVAEIKSKYDDYTLYGLKDSDNTITKGELIASSPGLDMNIIEDLIADYVAKGDLVVIPLSKQEYLKEELFVSMLEKPLTDKFDKVFKPKEIARQKDVKKWWGLLRKKGDFIKEDGVDKMLEKLMGEDVPAGGNLNDFIMNTFKAATKGVEFDSFGLDARADDNNNKYISELEEIATRRKSKFDLSKGLKSIYDGEFYDQVAELDEYLDEVETDGISFFDKDFDTHKKASSRILRRFSGVYNKAMRVRHLAKNKGKKINRGKQNLLDKELFESAVNMIAVENKSANEFILNIEKSALREVQAFNRYLDTVFPDSKEQLLASMHFVLSNQKHIVGLRNVYNEETGNYRLINSLSQTEMNRVDTIIKNMSDNFVDGYEMQNFKDSVKAIREGKETKEDYFKVLEMLGGYNFKLDKILEQGYITFKGINMPIETLISGYIKKGMMSQKDGNGEPRLNTINVYNARPLVEALINTNRKFTPVSSVKNAQGNMQPNRIINNHLTKEVDNMIEQLSDPKMTKEKFIKRFSHVNTEGKVPNQLLENIYDNFQKGILPQITRYDGLESEKDNKGNVYKDSTGVEQRLEDFLIFTTTSRTKEGNNLNTYLGNMGTFSDSSRKFFMNMNKLKLSDFFTYNKEGKLSFKQDGKVLNSIYEVHKKLFPGDPNAKKGTLAYRENQVANNKKHFRDELKNAIKKERDFIISNIKEINGLSAMKPYVNEKGGLNTKGNELIMEFVVNSIVNGYNVSDVFLPTVAGKNTVKRLKMNSSPVMSVKNPNFRIEPIPFADEINGDSIAGTDSGMFITKESAEKIQRLGNGLFEMNHGFKLLNGSIEKDNPTFKGKAAYLKGYTTIVDETHPMHKILKAREAKWLEWFKKNNPGKEPSMDLSDGTPNYVAIAVPTSADKSNFYNDNFIEDDANGDPIYTDMGANFTPEALSQNIDEAMAYYDKQFYDKKGEFLGIDAYNFGPQQLMDKESNQAGLPVQLINSIIVNASINDNLDLAVGIQEDISKAKMQNFNGILKKIQNGLMAEYHELVDSGLNKQEMNQAQRIIFEDKGSLSHPYLVEIVNNQLTKTLKTAGNRLITPGTIAHQKSDIGFKRRLKSYTDITGDELSPFEIVLPKHMSSSVKAREEITLKNFAGKSALRNEAASFSKRKRELLAQARKEDGLEGDLMSLKFAAKGLAKKTHKVAYNETDKYIGEVKNNKDVIIGYYVKGETVLVSRVPGHGPSSTGVGEVVGFDSGDGNQVMVPTEFNKILGSDNDGDALFIQTKGEDMPDWNNAFEKIKTYWLSKDMKEQIQATMVFEKKVKSIVETINKDFPKNSEYVFPFSPEQRMKDYNNTIVSKRSVGPVFNIHKITNLLAAYNIKMSKSITINKGLYRGFEDSVKGNESRNQQSAILANIILDNAKHGFSDDIGLNENNITLAVLLVNMGVPLVDVGRILNSEAAVKWSDLKRNNKSMFHENITDTTIFNKLYESYGIDPKNKDSISLKIDSKKAMEKSEQLPILRLLEYLSSMNGEVQKISGIMSGHNKIHTNPLVLSKQLEDFRKVFSGEDENKVLHLSDDFKSNPDLKNYVIVAEETLKHLRRINPVYRESTNNVFESFVTKIGSDMNTTQIEHISKDFLNFQTSRLLGLNNSDKAYVKDLLNPKSKTSIFAKLNTYINPLKYRQQNVGTDIREGISDLDNSVLFKQALSHNLKGNDQYISANAEFVNDSFNEAERERAQEEFAELPTDLKDDLILYDMITRGHKGYLSISPFFDAETNLMLNHAANKDFRDKNKEISQPVLDKLEKMIALKSVRQKSNPFKKIYLKTDAINPVNVYNKIIKDGNLIEQIAKGQGVYLNVRNADKKQNFLYEIPKFDANDIALVNSERSKSQKNQRALEIAKSKLKRVPDNLSENANIDIALIGDNNITYKYETRDSGTDNNLDPLVEATISYEEFMNNARSKSQRQGVERDMDAREDFYEPMFERTAGLSLNEFNQAMEYKNTMTTSAKSALYEEYKKEKSKANALYKTGVVDNIEGKSRQQLLNLYEKYGTEDVYAYSIIMTPIIKQLASRLTSDQAKLQKEMGTQGKGYDGKDISKMNAYLMTGATIPSNHPASQALARMLELEYKKFINEKKKYTSEMNKVTDALYKERLGYGGEKSIMNTLRRIRDVFTRGRANVYKRLYGNLVIREEGINDKGTLVFNYKLKSQETIDTEVRMGRLSKAEKDFYDYFKKTTNELVPKGIKEYKENYIPHTAMTSLEVFSSRGLLGLLANSQTDDQAIYDVKLSFPDANGDMMPTNFKVIEDNFKQLSATENGKNNIDNILEYRKLKSKAKKLLKAGKNEDGSAIIYSEVLTNTAMGFGAINRFSNGRSVKATELPSMDLNKALGDYIHSTLFVSGNDKFQGFSKLQGYIDGVLAFNNENNFKNMNIHIQKVWKDYFLRGKRQTSFMGKKADRVIMGLTRLNLFYALGYSANKNTKGMYAMGNVLSGKYHNIKDLGGKAWIKGESRFWGMDKGLKGGLEGVNNRRKRIYKIMKNINFMEINVYDEVNMEKKAGLDSIFTDLALSPMILSERWIQQTHMLGLLTEEELERFDEQGNYKPDALPIPNERLIQLEDQVKSSHGRGYQPTDQRAVQMYSWGNMLLQFSRFIPTMFHDRFARKDVNIYGRENIGTLRAVGGAVRNFVNDPKGFVKYRNSLSPEARKKLDSGMKGMAMASVISLISATTEGDTASDLFWDTNYYWNHPKLANKMSPAPIDSINNLVGGLF